MKIGIPKDGRFVDFGGKYIPETLAPAIEELEKNYLKIRNDPTFKKELNKFLAEYAASDGAQLQNIPAYYGLDQNYGLSLHLITD